MFIAKKIIIIIIVTIVMEQIDRCCLLMKFNLYFSNFHYFLQFLKIDILLDFYFDLFGSHL